MTIVAKYAGRCRTCQAHFKVGAAITYLDGKVIQCPSCTPAPVASKASASNPSGPSASVSFPILTPKVDPNFCYVHPQPVASVPATTVVLDEHQAKVVAWSTGVALVAAAAGSGKSFCAVERVARLITDGALPENVLTLVFNREAAVDFRARLRTRLGDTLASRVTAQTFHAWAYALLRTWFRGDPRVAEGHLVGQDDGPSPARLAGVALKATGLSGEWQGYVAASSVIREDLIDIDQPDAADKVKHLACSGGSLASAQALVAFARAYQKAKNDVQAIDFGDMLYFVCSEMRQATPRAEALKTTYAHVQVDEGQDCSAARLYIAQHLAAGAKSLMVIGDLRQNIYSGFAGARPDLFRGLLGAPTNATLLVLPVNRRSTAAIVKLGNRIAEGHDWNLGGDCSPRHDAPAGAPVELWRYDTEGEQATAVADDIAAQIAHGLPLVDAQGRPNFACLNRTRAAAAWLEAALLARKLPVRVLGSHGGVWSTSTGRDILAYLRAAEGIVDEDLTRVANKPLRYLKRTTVTQVVSKASATFPLVVALRAARDRGALRLADDIEELSACKWAERCETIAAYLLLDLKERAAEAGEGAEAAANPDEDKVAAYKALTEAAKIAGSIEAIEAQIEAVKKIKDDAPAVVIATGHAAKGKEWTRVYVCNATEGVLPHAKNADVEAERRLWFVMVTRAKQSLVVSTSGAPSEFVEELWLDGGGRGSKDKAPMDPQVMLAARDALARAAEAVEQAQLAAGLGASTTPAAAVPAVVAPPPITTPPPSSIFARLQRARRHAEENTDDSQAAIAHGAGSRYVEVEAQEMMDLVDTMHGAEAPIDASRRYGQLVFDIPVDRMHVIRVFSSIPVDDSTARDLGEDSIKVSLLAIVDGQETPKMKKQPYCARTRGWRKALVNRIEQAAQAWAALVGQEVR